MIDSQERKNPFMEPYGTPHDTVPFDKIRFEDFEPAFMEGIRRDDEQIAKIVNNPDEPTFDNTIAVTDDSKGEHYYDLLDRVSTVFSCLMSAETNDDMEALAQKLSPILTKHGNDVILNPRLFQRVKRGIVQRLGCLFGGSGLDLGRGNVAEYQLGQLVSLAVSPDLYDIAHTLIDLGAGFIRQQLVDDTLVQAQLAAITGNLEHIVL